MNHDLTHLLYILECITKIEKATARKTKKTFKNSGIIKDGVLYNLQTMSESTQKVSKNLKLMESTIP